jgi:hypothetical protein
VLRAKCLAAASLLGLLVPAVAADGEPTREQIDFFERKIRPVLVERCYQCHSAKAKELQGQLSLDTRAGLRQGGVSGPAIVPGEPEKSPLIEAIRYKNEDLKMPPEKPLSGEQVKDFVAWIKMGAPDPRIGGPTVPSPAADIAAARSRWPYAPVREPAVPVVKDRAWPRGEIDRFVLARLEAAGITPVGGADRRTLIRRATFDLLGLPPTPEEIDAFLADGSPDAFARVVNRLLDSPHYGERWGRHWLDVVRYADTAGDNSDYPVPQLYKYRNWVIDAVNRDLPYDQFIRQQIAGDLLPSRDEAERQQQIIATGYVANSKRFGSYEDARYPWHLTYEDTIDNLGRTFLGLTINCCRCHDHKFDPLTSEDYYALYGFFSSTRYAWPGTELDKRQHDMVPLASAEQVAAVDAKRKQQLAVLDDAIKQLERDKRAADKALKEAEKEKDESQRKSRLAEAKQRLDEANKALKARQKERESIAAAPLPFELAYAVVEGKTEGKKKVGNACIQIKGDPERQGREVPRRFPAVLGGQKLPTNARGSGRLELANWIAEPANPLTARVMVNRIWLHHFGQGLVPTPSDFGRQGKPPTHPELLDYLAAQFVQSGWSVKAMHRMMMLSRTYQLASDVASLVAADDRRDGTDVSRENRLPTPSPVAPSPGDQGEKLDPSNALYWKFTRRRLDAESIRDAILAVSGGLDRTRGGEHPFPAESTWDFTQHKPFKAVYETNRRSVYLMSQRIQRHPYLSIFDGPETNASTALRIVSTTPLQALFLMNDPFVHEQATRLAKRLMEPPGDDTGRIERAYLLLFGRQPTAEELAANVRFVKEARGRAHSAGMPADQQARVTWEGLARALFRLNEFVYVD